MMWIVMVLLFGGPLRASETSNAEVFKTSDVSVDLYTQKIQPIFSNRCVACHSCMNAPCQFNLQNYEAFQRGANKLNVYDGGRVDAVAPTRIWIDAHTTKDWRGKGFYPVNTSVEPKQNLFFQSLAIKAAETKAPSKIVSDSQYCPVTVTDKKIAMPYALPGLSNEQIQTLQDWIQKGAPGPNAQAQEKLDYVAPGVRRQLTQWEEFFNNRDLRHQLVSRYLFEHLFLAHIYFPESPTDFFRLVRSSNKCSEGVDEIATRRPNDSPGLEHFYYCFRKLPGAVVAKTHIPYEFTPAKKARFEELFFKPEWKVTRLPSYYYQVAENPFVAFADIPVRARYQFLLDDAQYEVGTFIKGPVCNGSNAVNSIQEQFYVFFIKPESEIMVRSSGFQDQSQLLLTLPGVWGSDIKLDDTWTLSDKLIKNRETYRGVRARWKKELFPRGYGLDDLWNGENENPNAVLTVLRHYDNAVVMKGAVGDLSKTIFVLDYPLLERLVYNLVVNFDVYGNVGHQFLTRIYMDMIRMEAEENFLSFLPPDVRIPMRKSWYQGFFAEAKMKYVFPILNSDIPTNVKFTSNKTVKAEFVQQVLFNRMNEKVRGAVDPINWKKLQTPKDIKMKTTEQEAQLRKIAAVKAEKATPFAQYLPDIALLKVKDRNGAVKVYSVIHNREHQNISWILGESLRMDPKQDSLVIREGFWGSYPNMFFDVGEEQLKKFVDQVGAMKSDKDYKKLITAFGVPRTKDSFWITYDELNSYFQKTDATEFGYLDLTRYEM